MRSRPWRPFLLLVEHRDGFAYSLPTPAALVQDAPKQADSLVLIHKSGSLSKGRGIFPRRPVSAQFSSPHTPPTAKRDTVWCPFLLLVEHRGFEPLTPTLPVLCAPNCANAPSMCLRSLERSTLSILTEKYAAVKILLKKICSLFDLFSKKP